MEQNNMCDALIIVKEKDSSVTPLPFKGSYSEVTVLLPVQMTENTIKHCIYDDCQMTFMCFKDVENAKELRQSVMQGEFETALLKTSMIADPFHVIVAANRAVNLHKNNKMTTKNVHSEVLFCLSPLKNITDSFRKFGLGDTDTSVFIVILNDTDGSVKEIVKNKVKGSLVPVEDVSNFTDIAAVKKLYKVTDLELSTCSLTDTITSKIASKEFVTV